MLHQNARRAQECRLNLCQNDEGGSWPSAAENIIAYVDDIVVMSKNEEDHIADLKETFASFREAGLKLNLEKCVFGVSRGKMLGYIIGPKGIRANPEK